MGMLRSSVYFLFGVVLSVVVASGGLISDAPKATSKALADISAVVADIPSQNTNFDALNTGVPEVPFYSQFEDISDPEWQKLGCGIADLAMLIEFYKPGIVSVNALLQEGISAGAFVPGAGWSHKGLAMLARNYGLTGTNATYDFSQLSAGDAFSRLEKFLAEGPVIASVFYRLEPGNPIPHLIVVNGVSDGQVFYNDPAESGPGYEISIPDFQKAWKKRLIVVRP